MTSKRRVAVLFGGRSAEHEVSLLSASNVVKAIDTAKYEVVPIAITRAGQWLLVELEDGGLPKAVPATGPEISLLPGGKGRLLVVPASGAPHELPPVDVVFPVLHGLYGEDGTVQGLAEVANVAYVGCGILGSATAMDKDIAKRLLKEAGLPVARGVTIQFGQTVAFDDIARDLGTPVFVKPVRQGSSIGVGKAATAKAFDAVVKEAFKHDRKVIVEEFVQAREIEFGVLEHSDGSLIVSVPGEIAPAASHGFYTYDAKYIDADGAALSIPADLPAALTEQLQDMAGRAFRALGCEGMARVDFFVRPDMSMVINEVNTIPGFTNISMYPKALGASGISYPELVDRLIQHGLDRAKRQGN